MWVDYSIRYIKYNKMTSLFLAGISFLSATLLSLLCGVFYNLWVDYLYRESLAGRDGAPQLGPVVTAYAFILLVACISLTAMIHHAFEVSMNSRLHQLGILTSVGATPRQVRSFLLQEALILSILPIVIGIWLGIGLCYGLMRLMIDVTKEIRTYEVVFRYHVGVAAAAFLAAVMTVLFSAWIPARRIGRLTPLEAIHCGGEAVVKKMRSFRLYTALFGAVGGLAGKSAYSRRKLLRTSALSLTFSFLAFTAFLNLEVISGISTQRTYFDRYRDKWDVMLTTLERQKDEHMLLDGIRAMEGVEECVSYKKIMAAALLPEEALSRELIELVENGGGAGGKWGSGVTEKGCFEAPVYVLDDDSFLEYCTANALSAENQAVAINQYWDNLHSSRTDKAYIPMVTGETLTVTLDNPATEETEKIPMRVSSFTDVFPDIREEMKQHSLTLIISETLYQDMAMVFPYRENHYNIRTDSDESTGAVYDAIYTLVKPNVMETLENRLVEEASDVSMRRGYKFVVGVLASFLAGIGIANVFSAVLGQTWQRKKEFARYLSIGMSPGDIRKILVMETLIIGLKPLLAGVIFTIPFVLFALNSAGLHINDYLAAAPVAPVCIFGGVVLFWIGLACFLGGREVCRGEIVEILKDDAMV